jgi:hypothetical protein
MRGQANGTRVRINVAASNKETIMKARITIIWLP